MMRSLRVWKHHTSTNIKTGWNEECINRADIWTKIVFGCNSDNFRGCLIKYYAWSMCLSNRVHPSMFVQVCLSEHVCSTNHQKIWTPLFLVREHFFIRNPLEWSEIHSKHHFDQNSNIFLVQMPSLWMNITNLEPNPIQYVAI